MGTLQAYFRPTDKRGAAPEHDKRDIVDAIFYLDKSGCRWRLLPKGFPPWQAVYDHWRRWNQRGVWEGALDEAHRKKTAGGLRRQQEDDRPQAPHRSGHARQPDPGAGACRQRTWQQGGLLKAAADKHAPLDAFSGGAGYRGTAVEFVETASEPKLHISQKIKDAFAVIPKRWVVERTFAWPGNYPRLAGDFEILARSAENMVRIAMIQATFAKCV